MLASSDYCCLSGCDRFSRLRVTLKLVVVDSILWICVFSVDLGLLDTLLSFGWKMFKSLRKLLVDLNFAVFFIPNIVLSFANLFLNG